jgi:photosystem II stability/assembly factor-like uncharacterized protein
MSSPSSSLRSIVLLLLVALGAAALVHVTRSDRGHRARPDALPPSSPSEALAALDFWSAARAYPGKVIPDIGHAAAFSFSKARLAGGPADREITGIDPWTPIGPHNIGGRTLAVAMNPENPRTLWAGAASGGLWRSNTAGVGPDAWDLVDTGFPVLGVSSIAIAPDDSNTLYIGTGEVYGYQNSLGGLAVRLTRGSYGIGVLKTTDGGATWDHSLDWSQNQRRGVAALAMHPTNFDILYAATTEGVFKTTDGGASWTNVHPVLMAMHIVIDPVDPDRVYVASGDLGSPDPGLYRSTDAGATWTQLTAGLPDTWLGKGSLSIYKAHPNVIYASLAQAETGLGLYRSTDHGDTWTRLNNVNYAAIQGWYSHWVHVDPDDSTRVLCGGINIWRSTDGGRNLTQVSRSELAYTGVILPGEPEGPANYAHADHHTVIYDLARPDTLYFGTDGGVFVSTDGGKTFAGRNGGYQSSQFYNGFTSSALDPARAMGGLQDSWTNLYEGSVAWRRKLIGSDGAWTALHPTDPSILFGSTQYLRLWRSLDGGQTWNQAVTGMGNDAVAFVAPYLISPAVPAIMYAGRTKMYRSTNGGDDWKVTNDGAALDGNPALSMGISSISPDWVYAGTAPVNSRARIFLTTDSGTSWTNVTGTLPDRYPVDIAVDPADHRIAYVALSGFGSGHLYRTTDAGATWTDLSAALPDVPSSAIAIDPDYSDHLYFGNDIGVYASNDAGQTWQEFQLGMPSASIVMDLSVVRITRRIRAVTHGHGVYERPLIDPTAGIGEPAPSPATGLRLFAAAPNPFAGTTTLRFAVYRASPVSVKVYDVTGRQVAVLLDARVEPGEHRVRLDAARLGLPAGVYVARVQAAGRVESQRLVLAR